MSCKDRDAMQPGDLVRIKYRIDGWRHALDGQLGVISRLRISTGHIEGAWLDGVEVMIDGRIQHFYPNHVELVRDAAGVVQ